MTTPPAEPPARDAYPGAPQQSPRPDHDVPLATGDKNSMVRHEERLVASTERAATKRFTLRKKIVEEEQTVVVTVRREVVEVVEEDLTADTGDQQAAPVEGHDLRTPPALDDAEETGELILHAERPLIATEWVPVERVRLELTTTRDSETVTADVAREVIDLVDESAPAAPHATTSGTTSPGDDDKGRDAHTR